jgi:ubiquinol-cytochrome c reductase cytochrome b subunit
VFGGINNLFLMDAIGPQIYSYIIKYPTPLNLNYAWNFGSMAGIFLVIQIISGFLLTFFYTPHVEYAFDSVEHIMRDVPGGWFIRYSHSNGASFFFLVVYFHILKGMYYGSYQYPRQFVWFSGVIIYILMMGTAFLGYVLPWGQMSYRAATVITNIVTVVPFVGKELVYWVWGGSSINNATLARFFSLHYFLPFIIAVLAVYHLISLHQMGSGNELGVQTKPWNKIAFKPYYIIKDVFGVGIILIFYTNFIFYFPELLSHSDNYIKANPLVTPSHIVPEWYFLPFYGISRSILDKTYGIIIMFISMIGLFFLPVVDKNLNRSKSFKFSNRIFFWFFISNFIFLGYLGSQAPISPYIELGVISGHLHLFYFFIYLPVNTLFEFYFLNGFGHKTRYLDISKV